MEDSENSGQSASTNDPAVGHHSGLDSNQTVHSVPSNTSQSATQLANSQEGSSASSNDVAPTAVTTVSQDHSHILQLSRNFLKSPDVQRQPEAEKRAFLTENGLTSSEINALLAETSSHRPTIPPRTYPQLPPSNLPNLLYKIARLFSWILGSASIVIAIYYYFLLPRIIKTAVARKALNSHQANLLRRLTESLHGLKESTSRDFAVLPRPHPLAEPSRFDDCGSLEDVVKILDEERLSFEQAPPVTVLRCAILEFRESSDVEESIPTTERIFHRIEHKVPWMTTDEGLAYETILWETLSNSPRFKSEDTSAQGVESKRWTYVPPQPRAPVPLIVSLNALSATMPKENKENVFRHVMQSLSDLTGYISSQVYIPYRPTVGFGFGQNPHANTVEADLRREIRAMKGLVLNRRSFMQSIPRPTLPSQ
ncbi:hypothetical protein FISHEDRAFT_41153 [Fistulina hepatica ATCC 64428]|nr:hypothetical protein FISHEDRAFT_41153 [Fistulina hepatica ATCC 64428]